MSGWRLGGTAGAMRGRRADELRRTVGPPGAAIISGSGVSIAETAHQTRDVDVLIIGAGQAGLGTAYWLTRDPALRVLVVDAAAIGHSWLERWDSLTLFTPRRFSALPGLRFPPGSSRYPSRTEMAAYLGDYAQRFALPVETGMGVSRLTRQHPGFLAATARGAVRARHVVVATGPFRRPHVPAPSAVLSPDVWQVHSRDYRHPGDVPGGEVLVVGGGNSAAQLAVELTQTHQVTVASPGPPWYLPKTILGLDTYWWTYLTGILNASHRARVSRYVRARGEAIIGTQLRDLVRNGRVRLLPHRVTGAHGRHVCLADGSSVAVTSVLWCTGFRPDTSWIEVPGATDGEGTPLHRGGASPVPGLHWMGLPWQTRLNSSIINGVHRDARATARRINAAPEYP